MDDLRILVMVEFCILQRRILDRGEMRDISLLPSTSASTTDYAHSLATQREDKKSCIEKGPNTNSWKGVDIEQNQNQVQKYDETNRACGFWSKK